MSLVVSISTELKTARQFVKPGIQNFERRRHRRVFAEEPSSALVDRLLIFLKCTQGLLFADVYCRLTPELSREGARVISARARSGARLRQLQRLVRALAQRYRTGPDSRYGEARPN